MSEQPSVVQLLLRDHRDIELLLEKLNVISSAELADYFCNLRLEVVRHEVAEELIIYPAFRKHVPKGDAIADSCMGEQTHAEKSLVMLESEEMDSDSFRRQLGFLRDAIIGHAKHEERDIFPGLEQNIPSEELAVLGERYGKALASAPTHPHPHASNTSPMNSLLTPMAALADRVRDAMGANEAGHTELSSFEEL